MKCPFCGENQTQVLESRSASDGVSIRRRRDCGKCARRFTTYERVEGPSLLVVKKSGRREVFERAKLASGVIDAVRKRPVSVEEINGLVDAVEREMLRKGKGEIQSGVIGKAVLRRLKRLDRVAWLRFASVYLEFEDLGDFEEMLESELK